jgi:hypothetical protein
VDKTVYARDLIEWTWDSVLEMYDWKYDMKFKNFKELRAGGKEWQTLDEN